MLVAAPGSAGGWKPTWRVVNRVRVQVGEQAQAVAGELLPRASRTQERWLDLAAGRRTC